MRHKLAVQLVALVVLVTLISGGGVGLLVLDRARGTVREGVLHSGLAAVDLAVGLAASYMASAQSDASDLADSYELRDAAGRNDLARATPKLESWLPLHPNLLSVAVVDLSGVSRATGLADKAPIGRQNSSERDWYQAVRATGRPFMGAAGLSPINGRPQVPYGVPVRDATGVTRAVLIASISLEGLSDTLVAVQLGPKTRTSLLDVHTGSVLAHVDKRRILQPTSGKNDATTRLEAGERGAIESFNGSGQATLAAFAPVPGLPWGVLIQEPSDDAFAPVDNVLRQVLLLMAVALALASVIGVGLALRITRPIRQLRTALEAMTGGQLQQRVAATQSDELGELGRGFNRMADQLQQTLTDLQDGEARFRGLISAAFDGFAIHDHGRIVEASESFARLFGVRQSDLVGRSVMDFIELEWRELIQGNIATGLEEPYECVGLKTGDRPFHMELVDNACRFEGQPARVIAVRDVTPRKQAEEQRSRMVAIVNSSSEAIVGTGMDANVTDWNGGAERLYGYSAVEMVGRPIAVLVPPEHSAEHTRTLAVFSGSAPIENLETIRLRKDGSRVNVTISISTVIDGRGQVIGAVTVAHNITERKAAEAALQESETRYRRLVELSPQAIMVHDHERILFANQAAARLVGATDSAQLLGTAIWDFTHVQHRAALQQRLNRLFADAAPNEFVEARLLHHRGQAIDVEISTIQTTYLGQPAYQITVDDVTSRKTAEKQAQNLAQTEKLRALGQMASGIAHDLNQSLMLVASYSDLAKRALDREPPDRAELADLFTTATQAALDGGEAVKRLLLFTRQAAEQEGQPLELATLVREVVNMTAPHWRDTTQVEGRPVSLQVETVGQPLVLGSAARLREALTNLVFNAVDALPQGGSIHVAVGSEDRQAVVRVTDSGVGMSRDVQARIFEPFYTTKGGSGTGLGLSMVMGIVEQHGGTIHVRSVPGEGTTFRLSFPLLESLPTPEVVSKPLQAGGPVQPLRVLAVDDEPAMTKAIMRMLRPAGHLVTVAGSGEEALATLATTTFDVVIADMGLGAGMNGWELVAAIKQRWPEVRFVLATGWGAAIDPAEARLKGVETVLAKPYRPADLELALAGPAITPLAA